MNSATRERYLQLAILIALLVSGYLFRVSLQGIIDGHPTDINNFRAWCVHVTTHSFRDFYQAAVPGTGKNWADYPPLYILVLWVLGKIYVATYDPALTPAGHGAVLAFLVKQPGMLADLAVAVLIYWLLRSWDKARWGLFCAGVFLFHPVVLYNSAIWGQMDALTLLLQLVSVVLVFRRAYQSAWFISIVNCLLKPQGLILMPLLGWISLLRERWRETLLGVACGLAFTLAVTWIFIPLPQALPWLFHQYQSQAELYPYTSIQAFNLWSLLSNIMQPDDSWGSFGFLLSPKQVGLLIFGAVYGWLLLQFKDLLADTRADRPRFAGLITISALILIAFFLFPTRMHERYLYNGLMLLLIAAGLNPRLWPAFIALSVSHFLNLVFEFPGSWNITGPLSALYRLNDFVRMPLWGEYRVYHGLALLNLLVFVYVSLQFWLSERKRPESSHAETSESASLQEA